MLNQIKNTISDISVMTQRNLIRYRRLPQLLVFSTVQPVMFVLLFVYVFGGAINTPTAEYVDYLLPGIIVQTVIFGAMATGIGLADDLSKGMIERFRSLPMARSAVLAGRIISDTLRNLFVVLLMTLVGLLLGFDVKTSFGGYLEAMAITLLLGFSFSWISALIGISVKNVETAQTAGFIWVFPLVFASSIFVPIATMPDWLQTIAKHSPITATVDTVRTLILGGSFQSQLGNALWWALAIVAVFMPWAVRRYRTSGV